ncbi:MAG: transcriptional regulator [Candidatus Marinimicrobia bacterium]|nr:transcriptional regulator [Candidatus Neomarinimicrobiota bacterium]MBL7011262.1 transcriptional regulator [Candidatus Neomarinimicrobiota bacterium]
MSKFEKLDPIIHAPVRLAIVTILSQVVEADFNYIKDATETTDGNLSTHLTKLEKAEFISITKSFSGKKPLTTCAITNKGRSAYRSYLRSLQSYLQKGE